MVVIDARIAQNFKPWGKFLFSPFVLNAKVIVAIFLIGPNVALQHLVAMLGMFVEVNQSIFNRDDFIGIAAAAVLLQKRIPAIKILPVKQRAKTLIGLFRCMVCIVSNCLKSERNAHDQCQNAEKREENSYGRFSHCVIQYRTGKRAGKH